MEKFFHSNGGRLLLVLGGVDLVLMGMASLIEDPAFTMLLLAWIPVISIAIGIQVVVLTTFELGGLLPVGVFSGMLFLAGVYAFGLAQSTTAGPAAGGVLISVGAIAALLGVGTGPVEIPHTARSAA